MELLNKIRQMRQQSGVTSNDKTGSNTKHPIYERVEQEKIQSFVDKNLDPMYGLFFRLGLVTGWRTTDLCELKYSDICFETGTASITVNKQTRAAESRCFNKYLKATKDKLKKRAAMAGDANLHMAIDMTDHKDVNALKSFMLESEIEDFETGLIEAVNNAPVKRDTKRISKSLLVVLAERQKANIFDDYVFSRRVLKSNRAKNQEGCVSRQTIWSQFRVVFNWFTNEVNAQIKLSAYSLRKTFAYNMLRGRTGKEDNLSMVCQAFGHSSIQMTMKYLGLSSKADELQAEMAELIV